jgi:hypothetical protein
MDALIIIGIVAVLVLAVVFVRKSSDSADTGTGGGAVKEETPVQAKAAAPAKKARAKEDLAKAPGAAKIPNKTALNKMTKKAIDDTAAELGIKLDARKNKADMIKEFQAAAKKLK